MSNDLSESLERDLKRYHLYANKPPHSFRHGGVVDSLRKDISLELTMYTSIHEKQGYGMELC